jgi:hypothetical protein
LPALRRSWTMSAVIPTATFIFDLRAMPQYASPVYPIYPQETAYVTSLSDRR